MSSIPEKEGEGASVELLTIFRPDKTNRAIIRRTEGVKVDTLLDHELGADKSLFEDLSKLVTLAEGLSRTEFPGVLKKLGLNGTVKAPTGRSIGFRPVSKSGSPNWASPRFSRRFAICTRRIESTASRPHASGPWSAATPCWAFSASFTGIPRTRRSRRARCCTLSDWWQKSPRAPRVCGTGRTPRR